MSDVSPQAIHDGYAICNLIKAVERVNATPAVRFAETHAYTELLRASNKLADIVKDIGRRL